MNAEDERRQRELERCALELQPSLDATLGHSWEMVVRAIHYSFFGCDDVPEIIAALEIGNGQGYQEINFEPWGEEVQVSLFDETVRCPFEAMLGALRMLREPSPAPRATRE